VLRRLVESAQYTAWAFGQRLRAAGLLGSMGRVASALDNSMMESFFGTLQLELLDRQSSQLADDLLSPVPLSLRCHPTTPSCTAILTPAVDPFQGVRSRWRS